MNAACVRPLVSVIVCTKNRSARLSSMFRTLDEIVSTHAWEIVCVDNGSTDDTSAVLGRLHARPHGAFQIVHEPRAGLGRARNAGLAVARGEFVFFTDDDCYVATDILDRIVSRFREDSNIGVIGGKVLLHNPLDFPITIQERAEFVEFPAYGTIVPGEIHGANFAFRANALRSIGGFDDHFGAGTRFCGEDIDAVARVLAAGWAGRYDPSVVVSHDHGRRDERAVAALRAVYARGRGAFYAKCLMNPSMRRQYTKQFYWALRGRSMWSVVRELSACAEYLATRLRRRNERMI